MNILATTTVNGNATTNTLSFASKEIANDELTLELPSKNLMELFATGKTEFTSRVSGEVVVTAYTIL
jgi:hypothetical protein